MRRPRTCEHFNLFKRRLALYGTKHTLCTTQEDSPSPLLHHYETQNVCRATYACIDTIAFAAPPGHPREPRRRGRSFARADASCEASSPPHPPASRPSLAQHGLFALHLTSAADDATSFAFRIARAMPESRSPHPSSGTLGQRRQQKLRGLTTTNAAKPLSLSRAPDGGPTRAQRRQTLAPSARHHFDCTSAISKRSAALRIESTRGLETREAIAGQGTREPLADYLPTLRASKRRCGARARSGTRYGSRKPYLFSTRARRDERRLHGARLRRGRDGRGERASEIVWRLVAQRLLEAPPPANNPSS